MRLDAIATILIFVMCFTLMLYHFKAQYIVSSRNIMYFYLKAGEIVEKNTFKDVFVEKTYIYSFNKTTYSRMETIGTPSANYIYTTTLTKICENGTIIIYKIYFKS